ncbi:MAG: prepilin peptidase, partial [Acidaminococcaceae bacterium]|nr:prepilin peptidase [Acidaminococcaceae bacterium]
SLAGALTGSFVLGVVWLLSRGGLGLGDVKFIGVLGLWLGVSGVVTGLALAFVTGGVAAAVLCLFGNASLQSKVPFGPFLSLGAVISFFYSSRILSWYWSLFI